MKNRFFILILLVAITGCRSSKDQKSDNIQAFADTYGLVRWFYPSDEAQEVDWNKFAVYGISEVKKCRTTRELKTRLESLFTPIAPGVCFSDTPAYEGLEMITPPDTSGMSVITWQHYGLDLGLWSNTYVSKRIGRPLHTLNTSKLAIYGAIPAAYFPDGPLTVSAKIKSSSGQDDFNVFFRVAINTNKGQDYISFCNTELDLISIDNDDQWHTYSHTLNINDDNRDLVVCVGVYTNGEGSFSLEDILFNGIKDNDLAPMYYVHGNPVVYDYKQRDDRLDIATKASIFEEYADFGEVSTRQLANGLYVHVPLALYGTKESTYPAANDKELTRIKNEIASYQPSDKDLMLSDIIVTWNVIKYSNPYLSDLDVVWDDELPRALEGAMEYDTYNSRPLRLMMALLEDAHVFITAPDDVSPDEWRYLPFDVQKINDSFFVSRSLNPQIYPGDIIKCVNGTDAMEGVRYYEEIVSGGSHYKNLRARTSWLRSFGECETVEIEIQRGDEDIEVAAALIPRKEYLEHFIPIINSQSEWLDDNTLYINLANTGFNEVKKLLENRRQDQTVILDMREGTASMLSDICNLVLDRRKYIPMRNVSHIPEVIFPETPVIDNPLPDTALREPDRKNIFITGPLNYSHHEEMLDYIRYAGLGYFVGSNTGGCNGKINKIPLPSGAEVIFTGTKVFSNIGKDHYYYSAGIKPDLYVENSAEDIILGIDAALNAALRLND